MAELSELLRIDGNGISIPSFREIRESIAEKWQAIFPGISLSSDTPDGHQVDLEARTIAFLLQALQAVASNLNVSYATGEWLDNLASLFGLKRAEGETDAELRIRIASARLGGFATYDGMLTYLRQKIAPSVSMKVNDEPEEIGGIPGHGFVVYVPDSVTATADEIAQAIWDCKPAGIRSYGSESGTAKDSVGYLHDIQFSHILPHPLKVRVTITEYEEEVLPENYAQAVAEAVARWAAVEYTAGKDVIPQRIITPVYSVPGIDTVELEVSENGTDWQTARIAVPDDRFVSIAADDVEVRKA